jgi:hypothetical protein
VTERLDQIYTKRVIHYFPFSFKAMLQLNWKIVFILNARSKEQTTLPTSPILSLCAKALTRTFTKLGFLVRSRDNLTEDEMVHLLKEVSNQKDLEQHDCFVCCILTHGCVGKVL